MNLYAALDLEREPFSNSPDPNFLLETRQHASCLQELEISLRLRRGLNVVTGDIGTGKTTLCRSLLRSFTEDPQADVHLLLDPHFDSPEEFLRVILGSVSRLAPDPELGLWQLKEALKQQLFRLGMVEKRLVILIIDEGQKISPENLELLREMLNFETNASKLLQIVIFAQRELEPVLEAMPNLADRISVRKRLVPLTLAETSRMIRHRLQVAAGRGSPQVCFSAAAMLALYLASGGSPRKIVRLAHMAMLEMLVRGKTSVGQSEVRAAKIEPPSPRSAPRRALAAAAVLCLIFGALWYSLGPAGPVLGNLAPRPEQTGQAGPALPEARDKAQMPAQAPELQRAARIDASALTLQPGEDGPPKTPASRLTLMPERDQGPDLRSPVDKNAPPQLHVTAPGEGPAWASRAALFEVPETGAPARKVAFQLARP